MSKETVADYIVKTLDSAGVKRIWGVTGDSLNGFSDSLRRLDRIEWMGTRHEEVAAFAAGAEAAITGELAVCAGSCGPGNMHLINGLFDCYRNRVPVVAIASHIPSTEIGSGYFQETHPTELFRECSDFCELVSNPEQIPHILSRAMHTAIVNRSVCVIVIPGDVALSDAPEKAKTTWYPVQRPHVRAPMSEIEKLAEQLNQSQKVTLLCGSGCAGAHDEVVQLAAALKAPIVHALRGKEHIEWDNPYDVGMTGFIGFSSGYYAMEHAETLVLLGTQFPYRLFYPTNAHVIQIDIDAGSLGAHCPIDMAILGEVKPTLTSLIPLLKEKTETHHLDTARKNYAEARKDLDDLATAGKHERIHPQYLAKTVSDLANDDAVFTCDVGTPTIWAARYLKMNGQRRLIGSFNHGSMANAMAQGIGIQAVDRKRQVIALCGDGGFSMLMGDMLSLAPMKLPLKVIIFNNSVLGFVAMEMKAAGFLTNGTALDNPDFAAVANAAGIKGIRVEKSGDLEAALKEALAHEGPVVVDVVTATQELSMPPSIKLEQMKGFSLYMMKAIMNGRGDEIIELAKTNLLR